MWASLLIPKLRVVHPDTIREIIKTSGTIIALIRDDSLQFKTKSTIDQVGGIKCAVTPKNATQQNSLGDLSRVFRCDRALTCDANTGPSQTYVNIYA